MALYSLAGFYQSTPYTANASCPRTPPVFWDSLWIQRQGGCLSLIVLPELELVIDGLSSHLSRWCQPPSYFWCVNRKETSKPGRILLTARRRISHLMHLAESLTPLFAVRKNSFPLALPLLSVWLLLKIKDWNENVSYM